MYVVLSSETRVPRVLIADDDPVNLAVMSALLRSRGIDISLAADGAEAVALACELPFDLVLMDLQMPVLDGLSATSAIRRFETLSSRTPVPVVAYSSLSPAALVLAAHGLNGSLPKPCADQELDGCLLRWCLMYRPGEGRLRMGIGMGSRLGLGLGLGLGIDNGRGKSDQRRAGSEPRANASRRSAKWRQLPALDGGADISRWTPPSNSPSRTVGLDQGDLD